MGHGIINGVVRPGPLAGCFAAARIDALQHTGIQAEGQMRVQVINEPDLVRAVAVQIEGDERSEPHTRNHASAQITLPQKHPAFAEQRHFQSVARKIKNFGPRIDVGLGGVDEQNGVLRTVGKAHRNRANLSQTAAKMIFFLMQ